MNHEHELIAAVKQISVLKEHGLTNTGNMPLVVFLDSNDPIFGRSGKGPHAFHFVSITGYNPATGKVKMSNQWGQAKDKEVPIADLWRAMKFRKS